MTFPVAMNMTRERVRQIELTAMIKLKFYLEAAMTPTDQPVRPNHYAYHLPCGHTAMWRKGAAGSE